MVRVRLPEESGPGSYTNRSGLSVEQGETAEVDAETAEYLVEEWGFEYAEEADGGGDVEEAGRDNVADADAETDGQGEPDEEGGDGSEEEVTEPPFAPGELTVGDIEDLLNENEYSETELLALYSAEEKAGGIDGGRKTALDAIEERLDEIGE